MDIGTRIKTMRLKRGLSQKALSDRIGKASTTISCYENGIQIPPTEVLESIAHALYTPIDYFFGVSSEKTYSDSNLLQEQKEVVDLLFKEFTMPTSVAGELSTQQVEIIRRIILLFTGK